MTHRALAFAIATLSSAVAPAAFADQAACEAAVRALMTNTETGQPAVKHVNATTFAGQTTTNITYTTGFNEGMAGDENGVPVSLFRDGKFFTTSDRGETWTLVREYTEAERADLRIGVVWQADNAENFACATDVDLNGRVVHHYAVDYRLYSTKDPARTEYWVDPETGFVWQTLNTFHFANGESTVLQVSEPAPDFVLPNP